MRVSINIPTYNSGETLSLCLQAVFSQTYPDFEVIVIDGNSTDQTAEIARNFGVDKFLICSGGLLQARYEGIQASQGEFILLLDSDQILEENTLERAVQMMGEGFDALVLEEDSYQAVTLTEKLFQLDRKLLHRVRNLDPGTGAVLTRFYRTGLLQRAIDRIPRDILPEVNGEDHQIIYFEFWQLSQKVGILSRAVKHIEPSSIRDVIKSSYRWGYTRQKAYTGKYRKLLARELPRLKMSLFPRGMIKESLASLFLLVLRGIPGELGFYKARFDHWQAEHGNSSPESAQHG